MSEASPTHNAQAGLGVDIVAIERMEAILGRSPAFIERVFTAQERSYCDKRSNSAQHYAMRFAAKEAVVKAFGTGFSQGIRPIQIEVIKNAKGKPSISLHGAARDYAKELAIVEIPLSLSYTHTEAVACALVLTESTKTQVEKSYDPTEEITQKFKEARGWLDELPATQAKTTREASHETV